MNKYPLYKDSGIEWVGYIPENWVTITFKYLISESNAGEVIDKNYWNVGRELLYTCQKIPIYSDFQKFPKNKKTQKEDLLLTRNGTPYIHLPKEGSIYSNVVQRVKLTENCYKDYVVYYLKFASKYLKGNGDIIESFNMDMWKNIMFSLPSLNEQKNISVYLNKKTIQLDELISKKQQLIELLKEKRQIMITEAVTKGLDDNAEMKDSGIEWIGAMPKHWELKKLKYKTKLKSIKANENDKTKKYTGLENVESWTGRHIHNNLENQEEVGDTSNLYDNGDLLFGKLRPYLAKCVITECEGRCSSEFLILKTVNYETKFLQYIMLTPLFIDLINSSTYGVKMPRASWDFVSNISLTVPPIKEQLKIVNFLNKKTVQFDSLIEKINKEIQLLEEKKQVMIYEAVTGKKKIDNSEK